jgi:hypothetical protein
MIGPLHDPAEAKVKMNQNTSRPDRFCPEKEIAMKKNPRFILVFFIFVWPLAFTQSIKAGFCYEAGPVCSEYWKTDIVFVGRVTELYQPEIAQGENWAPAKIARFSVEEVFRGAVGKEIEIAASIRRSGNMALSSDSLGYNSFDKNQRYLVYAYRSTADRWVWASGCSRTRPLSEAAEDINYIRGLKTAKPGGTILGFVRRQGEWIEDDRSGPLSGVKVTAHGKNGRFHSVTDSRGEYRIDGLNLGRYKVSFVVPSNLVTSSEPGWKFREVAVQQDRGCVETNFLAYADGAISGKVTDTDGRLIPGVNVDIVAAGVPEEEQQVRRWLSKTDVNGRYEIRHIPPGKYFVGINIADVWGVGYEASYYPGVTDPKDAKVFSFAEGQKYRNYDFVVPTVTARRTISGVARLTNTKNAAGALVALESSVDGKPRWDLAVKTDAEGRFSITEHDSYIIRVHVSHIGSDGKKKHAEPVWLEKRIGVIEPFEIWVQSPGAFCTHYRNQK